MRNFLILFFISLTVHYSSAQQGGRYSSDVRERLYLHTDRESYLVGEMIWFKAYLTIGKENELSELSKIIYIEILDRYNQPLIRKSIQLRGGLGNSVLYLPYSLKSGGYRLRAYSRWMRNDSADTYFEKFISIINPLVAVGRTMAKTDSINASTELDTSVGTEAFGAQISLAISKNKEQFTRREKVSLTIESPLSKAIPAHLSLSVYKIDSLDKYNNPGIDEYFKKFSFEENQINGEIIPEYEGRLISGKISACGDEPTAGKIIYLYNRGSNTIIYTARANENGEFLFVTSRSIPNPSVLIKPDNPDDCYKIDLKEPYSTQYSSNEIPPFSITENDLDEIARRSVYMQVYNTNKDQYLTIESQDYTNFFESGYVEYNLDDYIRFDSFETTIREYVSEVSVNRKGQRLSYKVKNEQSGFQYAADPLILLDGVVVVDHNKLKNINPNKIEKLRIERDMVVIGEVTFYGVIGIYSKPNINLRIQNPNEYRLSNNPGNIRPQFPEYQSEKDRESPSPDFRTLLYWNPDLTLTDKKEIEFYTSDVPGMYKGVVEGMNYAGELFSTTFYFKVE